MCPNQTFVERVRTQRGGQQPVDNEVSVASDRRCEVSVERNVEGVVLKEMLALKITCAEVQRHLGNTNNAH